MNVDRNKRQALHSWLFVGVLTALCAILGVLQYRWIGEVSRAERERLRASLEASLHRLSQDFNAEITAACSALLPSGPREEAGRESAYATRYAHWREAGHHTGLFRRIALAVPQENRLELLNLDLETGTFAPAEWPANWNALRDRHAARLFNEPFGMRPPFRPVPVEELELIELPRFGRSPGPPDAFPARPPARERAEAEWLILELDTDYVGTAVLPELIQRHLGGSGKQDYQVEVVAAESPSTLVYRSGGDDVPRIGEHADASVRLFDVQYEQIFRRAGLFRPREGRYSGGPGPGRGRGLPPGMEAAGRGRWLLSVRHRAGSLEAVVARARWRNLAVTTGILGLLLATVTALVRFTRRAHKLAELQMEFVAGVSHELRTPLSVIRTAGHNLGGGLVKDEAQVQRYGALIRDEAERLTGIVEQVLRFASARAGRAIGAREPVAVPSLIEDALAAAAGILDQSHCSVEKQIAPGLPPVLADPIALQHALQNLLTNAAKYGTEGGWIGISASAPEDGGRSLVEIRVQDRGPGIPADELAQIFDPFYRGKRAIEDQIHGTGLGLSLVKRIVEAHEGTVTVLSQPGTGTEFVLRIPAAPGEPPDEAADSSH